MSLRIWTVVGSGEDGNYLSGSLEGAIISKHVEPLLAYEDGNCFMWLGALSSQRKSS
jgi:hypothetical protein